MRKLVFSQKTKRMLSMLLTFAMLLSMLSVGVFAEGGAKSAVTNTKGEFVYYVTDDTELTAYPAGQTSTTQLSADKVVGQGSGFYTYKVESDIAVLTKQDTPTYKGMEKEDAYLTDAILFQVYTDANDTQLLEFNVVYSAKVDENTPVVDLSGNNLNSLNALSQAMGQQDAFGYADGLEKAVSADLYIKEGNVVAVFVTDVSDRPTIGISWKTMKPTPTNPVDDNGITKEYRNFGEAFCRNGARVVYLEQIETAEEAREVLKTVDGIFMTGGSDWNNYLYGETKNSPHGSNGPDVARDTSDLHLMQQATALDVPMLAVCRGEQGFNIAMGGKLIQDVPTYLGEKVANGEISAARVTKVLSGQIPTTAKDYDKVSEELRAAVQDTGYTMREFNKDGSTSLGATYNKTTGEYVAGSGCEEGHLRVYIDGLIHSGDKGYHVLDAQYEGIGISEKSKWLYDIIGSTHIDQVATAHHQSVDPENLGEGLTIVARSSDGIVEAIEHQDSLFSLALQWHPERDAYGGSNGAKNGTADLDLCNAPLRALVQYAGEYADNHAETYSVDDAILYQVYTTDEDVQMLDYNVVYSTAVDGKVRVIDTTRNHIDSVAKLADVMGTPDNLGKAVTADLIFVKDSDKLYAVSITDVSDRPTVGISWKSDSQDYTDFKEAFNRNGAKAVELPKITSASSARAALAEVDGIFVTGGEDWNPALYNEEAYIHGSSGWNDVRDTSDLNLMQQAIYLDVPMLTVCRGTQGLNIAMGGGLIQDVPTYLGQQVKDGKIADSRATVIEDLGIAVGYHKDENGNWKVDYEPCDPTHYRVSVDGLYHSSEGNGYHVLDNAGILDNSKWLYNIFGTNTLNYVATAHHQSVNPDKLGDGLTIVARSSDGIVEAIEHQGSLFALGLQWHPERDALGDTRGIDVDQDQCNAPLRTLVKYAGIYAAQDSDDNNHGGGGGGGHGGNNTPSTSTTTKNPDGSTTVAVTDKATGTVTATTTYPGGAKVVSETTKDGKVTATVTVPSNVKSVTVTIPAEDATDTTVAVIVHPDGTREVVKSSILNETGIAVTLTEGAKLELVDNEKSFSDVSGKQWFADAVAFVTSREIFSGVGGGSFAPDDSMTRAMLWTVLFSLDGGKGGGGVWYADAQKWAMDNGISDGTTPDGSITREQLALIMYNFAKDRGYDMTASRDLSAFTDAGQAADWSVDALKWAVGSGLLSGKGNSVLDPTGGATRAEVAQILMTFMQSLAD